MHVLSQSTFLHALGWSLLDSLWQMGLLWLIYQLLLGLWPQLKPSQRHSLALVIFQSGTLWFIIDMVWNYHWPQNGLSGYFLGMLSTHGPGQQVSLLSITSGAIPILSLAYLLSITLLFFQLYRQFRFTHYISRSGKQRLRGELALFIRTWSARMGIRNEVRAWISDIVDTPLTIGFWKPVILLPVALLNNLSISQAETVILHELQHIKRHDYVINIIISLSEILLFFNPFARLLAQRIRRDRELSCDDLVLNFPYEPADYAAALLLLEKSRRLSPVFAIPATGKDTQALLSRVRRILKQPPLRRSFSFGSTLALLLSLMVGFWGFIVSHRSGYSAGSYDSSHLKSATSPGAQQVWNKVELNAGTSSTAALENKKIKTGPPALSAREISHREPGNERTEKSEYAAVQSAGISAINTNSGSLAEYPLVVYAAGAETPSFTMRESPRSNSIPGNIGQPYVPSGSFNAPVTTTAVQVVWQRDHLDLEMLLAVKTANLLRHIAAEENPRLREKELAKLGEILQQSVEEQDWPLLRSLILARLQFVQAAAPLAGPENSSQPLEIFSPVLSRQLSADCQVAETPQNQYLHLVAPVQGESDKISAPNSSPEKLIIKKIVIL